MLIAKVFENSSDGIMITDARGVILCVNHAFTRVTGYASEEAIGRTPRMLKSGRQSQAFYKNMWAYLLKTGSWQGEIWNRRKSGEIYPEWLMVDAIKDEKGSVTHYLAVFMDITEKEQLKKELILAGKIQAELLPLDFEERTATVRTIYQPYRYVSGDLYDYKWKKERTILFGYLMDVMGHGLATALQTSALRVLFHQIMSKDDSLTDKLFYINNEALRFFTDDTLAAAICFEFDFEKHTLTYASAGINYFISSAEHLIKIEGTFLGVMEDVCFEQHVLHFNAGDCFYFMTDGLFDALPQSFRGTDSFERTVKDLCTYAANKGCKDDASAICLKVNDNHVVRRSG
ncbi:PAS domain S-box protein [Aneurinibacillus sp. Ricciae_BoGa-3]|uniref:SpoIIE family protein phosphatase n=1 Tax=Aneurinibacillus sp. Ricciae_BoGa-3 TaxID=3022697 RepID=UPI00234135C7|nr:SpoIIE family protein phosphatase [Aneurinibacillus sp. Ricciae_BoGa-3]WCK53931.1 PAS domain S-box protein [Aneurinibacillus sp. Ricciae_BoGa-3]